MSESLTSRLADVGAGETICGKPMHADAHDLQARAAICSARPHSDDQPHIATDTDGKPVLQWHDAPLIGDGDDDAGAG